MMLQALPAPQVLRCYFDDTFTPPLPVMCLRWAMNVEGPWELPEDVRIAGPGPQQFGITIERHGSDTYAVRLLWDRTSFGWQALTRSQLLGSALAMLLDALGTDLWYLLDQPVRPEHSLPARAA
jgi:hypothetical protein